MEDLQRLESRLLEVLEEAEEAQVGKSRELGGEKEGGWTIVPGSWSGRKDIAMGWLPVRGKALELVRQREALGNRVLFAQMSMMSSYVKTMLSGCKVLTGLCRHIKNQDVRAAEREVRERDRMERLEKKLGYLEDLLR